ncbi:HamA C-terminal domain-containing protein [Planococcus plakortidis]
MVNTIFSSNLLFEKIVEETDLLGLCAGYEESKFRCDAIVDLIFEALPDFALSETEKLTISAQNMTKKMKKAAKAVYSSEKYKSRGEFGEVLLHILLRDYFNTIPAISKIYFKDGANETVKGFDAVHIVPTDAGLELWLGEVKFYKNINSAIRDVVAELSIHTDTDYLRSEFLFISNKIDNNWPYAEELTNLIDNKVSIDKILKKIKIPVFLTYDSSVVGSHVEISELYTNELSEELKKYYLKFKDQNLPDIEIHLVLMPLEKKEELVNKLDEKLRMWQSL